MEQDLIDLGLTFKEARAYLALLSQGPSTISEVARLSGLNRTTVYDVFTNLQLTGLVRRVPTKKKITYMAEPPDKLPVILESRSRRFQEQADKARSILPQLKLLSQKQKGAPKVSYFEGDSGIKSLYEDSLLSKEEIRSFSSTESLESFDPQYLHSYYKQRATKKIFIQAIINNVPSAHEYKKEDKDLNREIRIVPKEMLNIRPEIYIYENKISIFSLKEKFAVQIQSADIADALKKLYDMAWRWAGDQSKRKITVS